jgi:hypothetical protein
MQGYGQQFGGQMGGGAGQLQQHSARDALAMAAAAIDQSESQASDARRRVGELEQTVAQQKGEIAQMQRQSESVKSEQQDMLWMLRDMVKKRNAEILDLRARVGQSDRQVGELSTRLKQSVSLTEMRAFEKLSGKWQEKSRGARAAERAALEGAAAREREMLARFTGMMDAGIASSVDAVQQHRNQIESLMAEADSMWAMETEQVVREITAVVRKFYEERRPMSRDRGQLQARLKYNDALMVELEAQRQRIANSAGQWSNDSRAWYGDRMDTTDRALAATEEVAADALALTAQIFQNAQVAAIEAEGGARRLSPPPQREAAAAAEPSLISPLRAMTSLSSPEQSRAPPPSPSIAPQRQFAPPRAQRAPAPSQAREPRRSSLGRATPVRAAPSPRQPQPQQQQQQQVPTVRMNRHGSISIGPYSSPSQPPLQGISPLQSMRRSP